MTRRLQWDTDGADWPNRFHSRFVTAAGQTWHVQQFNPEPAGMDIAAPAILLVHGTAASTHSWRDFAPLLASAGYHVIVPDLPGHGFSDPLARGAMTIPAVAKALAALMAVLAARPVLVVGHSAGAAILVQMALDGDLPPAAKIVALNGALMPFGGLAGQIFAPLARAFASSDLVSRLASARAANATAVARVLESTGSKLDPAGVDYYARLFRSPAHVAAALGMMANWDLPALVRRLPHLGHPLHLLACSGDTAVPPQTAFDVQDKVPSATVEYLRGPGHLAHEEQPQMIADIVLQQASARQSEQPGAE